MIARKIFNAEHEMLRDQIRKFVERELVPHHDKWEEDGAVSREAWRKAGDAGLLCMTMPEEYGGAGADVLHSAILMEELAYANLSGPGFGLHSDIVAPYILHYGTEEQKKKYLPPMARGEVITAIAMTEPGAGSDLQGVKTTAVRKGNGYLLNGQKTFITNGQNADLVIVVAKTSPAEGAKGISLFLVESRWDGFKKGRNLKKIGMKAQDTSELFFQDVNVPVENLLGGEDQGFACLMQELPWERLQIAISAIANAEAALRWTIDYTRERKAFGRAVADFQTTRHVLAEIKTELTIARVYVDRCLELMAQKALSVEDAAMAKWWTTDLQNKIIDRCLQLHGGYGYMWEYPIARAFADARVQRIYGGSNEIMKELIARSL